jgi:hypothetical protein
MTITGKCRFSTGTQVTLDTETGTINCKYDPAIIKSVKRYGATWNPTAKTWTLPADYIASWIDNIIVEDTAAETPAEKTIVSSNLINGDDGFYTINTWSDGTKTKSFVG